MDNWLQGFREFLLIEGEAQAVPLSNGLAEIQRLETSHYLLVVGLGHQVAARFVQRNEYFGHQGLEGTHIVTFQGFQKLMSMVNNELDLVVAFVPKRWFKKTQRKGTLLQQIEEFLPEGNLPNNYVWGILTKWNDNSERVQETPFFYRNPRYHANDSLKDASDAHKLATAKPQPMQPTMNPTMHGFASAEPV